VRHRSCLAEPFLSSTKKPFCPHTPIRR